MTIPETTHAVYCDENGRVMDVIDLLDQCNEYPPCGGCGRCLFDQVDDEPDYYINPNDPRGCQRCKSDKPCVHVKYARNLVSVVESMLGDDWQVE